MQLRQIMSHQVETVSADTTVAQAARKMLEFDVGALPVRSDSELVGIVTDRDIAVRAIATGMDPSNVRCDEVMTPDVISCPADFDLAQAAHVMTQHRVRRLVAVNEDQVPVGIVSLGDLAVHMQGADLVAQLLRELSVPG